VRKNWHRIVVFGGLLGLGLGFNTATAAMIPILSGVDLLHEGNNVSGTNVILTNFFTEPVWKAPTKGGKWISYAQTGWGPTDISPGNTSLDGPPTAIFTETFTLDAPSVAGSLVSFWADDTAGIFIDANPVPLFALPPNVVVGTWCLDTSISCQPSKGGTVDLAGLSAGTHTLTIKAYQIGGATFGLLYEGAVITAIPEPATFVLFSLGMAFLLVRRRHARG
jgi:hypothetical protein